MLNFGRFFYLGLLFSCIGMFKLQGYVGENITPGKAIELLMAGNQRYVNDQPEHANRNQDRRLALIETQKPFATILGCSDSRVSPEIIFDQGLGDLFIVRVAGNVLGSTEMDSIHFAVLVLNSAAILVLGHENCGAVQAVLNNQAKGFNAIAEKITPAISNIQRNQPGALKEAVKANVKYVVSQLKKSPELGKLIDQKKLDIVGGYYNLSTGEVELVR